MEYVINITAVFAEHFVKISEIFISKKSSSKALGIKKQFLHTAQNYEKRSWLVGCLVWVYWCKVPERTHCAEKRS